MKSVLGSIWFWARQIRAGHVCIAVVSIFYLLLVSLAAAQSNAGILQTVQLIDDGTSIRVPVRVFESTKYFSIDTGSTICMLDSNYKEKLGKPLKEAPLENGLVGEMKVKVFAAPDIFLGETKLNVRRILCSELTLFRLVTGEPFDGVIGMDALDDYTVVLDFDQSTLALYSKTPAEFTELGKPVPLISANGRYHIEATANRKAKVQLLLDSGSGNSISLNRTDWEQAFADSPQASRSATLGTIGGHIVESPLARLKTLTIGSRTVTNLVCTLSKNPTSYSSVGLPFLRQYRVAFDFPNKLLYLAPRLHVIDEEWDMSGLHLLRQSGLVAVYSVDPDSPADKAGIKARDIITVIDGKNCTKLTMRDIRQHFKTKDGNRVKVKVFRNGEVLDFEFQLRKMI